MITGTDRGMYGGTSIEKFVHTSGVCPTRCAPK